MLNQVSLVKIKGVIRHMRATRGLILALLTGSVIGGSLLTRDALAVEGDQYVDIFNFIGGKEEEDEVEEDKDYRVEYLGEIEMPDYNPELPTEQPHGYYTPSKIEDGVWYWDFNETQPKVDPDNATTDKTVDVTADGKVIDSSRL